MTRQTRLFFYNSLGSVSRTYTFDYNGYGQRIQKKYTFFPGLIQQLDYMSSKTINYTYDNNGRLIKEYHTLKYSDGETIFRSIVYLYDESDVVGMAYTNNGSTNVYYFNKNIFGDVIEILDISGNIVVRYKYDAWGNCTTVSSDSNLAAANPFRYRSYYYDEDTGLYYLNARYYNPKWRRFISPDSSEYIDPESVNGLNLYAYCNNDPVNYKDPSGHFGFWAAALIGAGVLGVIGLGATAYEDYADDGKLFNGSIGINAYISNALVAASFGALAGGLLFTFAPAISGFLGSSFTLGSYALASGEIISVTLSGAQIAGGAIAAGLGIMFARTSKSGGYYGEGWPGDPHKPEHIHLRGNGADIRIGKDGNPLPNEPKLTAQQKKALKRLWKEFQKMFDLWKKLNGV